MGQIRMVAPSLSKISDCRKIMRLSRRKGFIRRTRPKLPLCRRSGLSSPSTTSNIPVCPRKIAYNPKQLDVISEPIKWGFLRKSPISLPKQKSSVQFRDEVSILSIKSHRDYAKHILDSLYLTKKERKENLKRNKLEFLADGKDWRNVLEEDSMLVDENGEYFHPVHTIGLDAFIKKRKVQENQITRI